MPPELKPIFVSVEDKKIRTVQSFFVGLFNKQVICANNEKKQN
jgi:hypothetical protein